MQWVIDIAFNEDRNRISKVNGLENLAIIRKIALNLLKQEKTLKIGIKGNRLRFRWDPYYLDIVLSASVFRVDSSSAQQNDRQQPSICRDFWIILKKMRLSCFLLGQIAASSEMGIELLELRL